MKAKYQILTLGIAGAITCIGAANASGLTYQTSVTNSFTIDTSVSVSLSSDSIVIDELTPGKSKSSDPITVTVSTNSSKGYHLNSTVGVNEDGSRYKTTSLVHSSSGVEDAFASLAEDASVDELSTPGTWGYATSKDSFAKLSGLPLDGVGEKALTSSESKGTDTLEFKIAAIATSTQASGEYNNYINFIATAEPEPTSGGTLYDLVAAAWENDGKRVQTNDNTSDTTGIQKAITTTNSGVFKYDPTIFGAASDASNDYSIYYYRGILDNTVGTYGSDGDNAKYPNTVVLSSATKKDDLSKSDTCWRIVRTTGSGGVKMVYSGKWTGSTCARSGNYAQVTTSAYNSAGSGTDKSIVKVGYTFDNSRATTTGSTRAGTLFGTNSSYSGNSTDSTIKTYIENTWFTKISAYESKLEPSAGYCNDRSVNTGSSWTTYSDTTSITTPYAPASSGVTAFYFGARMRNLTTYQIPSLTCPRNVVDLYTASGASNGNKQLSKPVALLTADELSFAGSGRTDGTQGSGLSTNSYLLSGSYFWLLSPYYRSEDGGAYGFSLYSSAYLNLYNVSNPVGVRPAISLISGTSAAFGSGTAADPWVVNP